MGTKLLSLLLAVYSVKAVIEFPTEVKLDKKNGGDDKKHLLLNEYKCSDYDFKFNEPGAGVISVFRNSSEEDSGSGSECPNGSVESCENIEEEICNEPLERFEDCEKTEVEECEIENAEECSETVTKNCHPAGNETKIGAVCIEEVVKNCKLVPKEICKTVPKYECENEVPICEKEVRTVCKTICNKESSEVKKKEIPTGYGSEWEDEDSLSDPDLAVNNVWTKISANMLFFPWVQWYRAPNVVREELLETNAKDADNGEEEEVSEDDEDAENEPEITSVQSRELQMLGESNDIFSQVAQLNRTYLSKVPGCYPLVLPISSTFASFYAQMVSQEEDGFSVMLSQGNSTFQMIQALKKFEPKLPSFWSLFAYYNYIRDSVDESSLASMIGGHIFSESDLSQMFGYIGSYLGLSFKKDFNIAKCEVQDAVEENWAEYKEALNQFQQNVSGKPYPLENLTIGDIFFSCGGDQEYSLSIGEYNLTDVIEEYNISETMYSAGDSLFKNFDPIFGAMTGASATVSQKLRTEMEDMELREDVTPHVRIIQEKIRDAMSKRAGLKMEGVSSRKIDRALKKEHKEDSECDEVDATNVQHCYEIMIKEVFESVEEDRVEGALANADLLFITYLAQMHMYVAIMLTLMVSTLAGMQDFISLSFPCMYDVIDSEHILLDLPDVRENGTSFLQVLTRSIGRENFIELPNTFIDSMKTIMSSDDLFPGLGNVTEAVITKLGTVSSNGRLAGRLSYRMEDLREWMLGMDILQVLDSITQLVKTLGSYCWRWYSGEWTELEVLVDSVVSAIGDNLFWERLFELMVGVAQMRWEAYETFVQGYFTPMLLTVVYYVEWLAEDVKGNLQELAFKIAESDAEDSLWTYYGRLDSSLGEFFVCRDDFSLSDVSTIVSRVPGFLTYLEPGFAVFDNICYLFDTCDSEGTPHSGTIAQNIEKSGIRAALKDIQSRFIDLKRALVCRPETETDVEKAYWEQLLL